MRPTDDPRWIQWHEREPPKGEQPFVEFYRADQNCLCECGEPYRCHYYDWDVVDQDGHPFLHILCNGDRVKL